MRQNSNFQNKTLQDRKFGPKMEDEIFYGQKLNTFRDQGTFNSWDLCFQKLRTFHLLYIYKKFKSIHHSTPLHKNEDFLGIWYPYGNDSTCCLNEYMGAWLSFTPTRLGTHKVDLQSVKFSWFLTLPPPMSGTFH